MELDEQFDHIRKILGMHVVKKNEYTYPMTHSIQFRKSENLLKKDKKHFYCDTIYNCNKTKNNPKVQAMGIYT